MSAVGKRIYYPKPGGGETVVELLSSRRAQRLVPSLLEVINEGYQAQFEAGDNPTLPRGTVAARYAPTPENIERYSRRTHDHFEDGSRIAAVFDSALSDTIIAFAKVSPAEKAGDAPFSYGCYLNDVIARKHRTGAGSVALHAALARTNQAFDRPLVLEGFTGSSVNTWYEKRLGLVAVPAIQADGFPFNAEHTLPMTYYTTPADASLGTVVQMLEERSPYLARATRNMC